MDQVELIDTAGSTRAVYGDLAAIDAGGRELLATLEVNLSSAELVIDDALANYPIVIDPLVANLEAELPPKSAHERFKQLSIALSLDTAVVSAAVSEVESIGSGGVKVFASKQRVLAYARSGNTWPLQHAVTLQRPPFNQNPDDPVAVSGDTVFVGAPGQPNEAQQGCRARRTSSRGAARRGISRSSSWPPTDRSMDISVRRSPCLETRPS